jgi:hypothetical protein
MKNTILPSSSLHHIEVQSLWKNIVQDTTRSKRQQGSRDNNVHNMMIISVCSIEVDQDPFPSPFLFLSSSSSSSLSLARQAS